MPKLGLVARYPRLGYLAVSNTISGRAADSSFYREIDVYGGRLNCRLSCLDTLAVVTKERHRAFEHYHSRAS